MNDSLEIPVDRIPLNPPKPSKTAVKEPEPAKPEAAPTPPPPQHWVGEAMRDLLTWNSKKTVIGSAVVSLALGAMTINAIMNRTPPPPQEARLQTIPTTKTETPPVPPDPVMTIPVVEPRPYTPDPQTPFRPASVEPIPTPTMPGVITVPPVTPTITEGPSTLAVSPIPQPSAVSAPPIATPNLIIPTAATEPVQPPATTPAAPGKIEGPSLPVVPGGTPSTPSLPPPSTGPAAPTLPPPIPTAPAELPKAGDRPKPEPKPDPTGPVGSVPDVTLPTIPGSGSPTGETVKPVTVPGASKAEPTLPPPVPQPIEVKPLTVIPTPGSDPAPAVPATLNLNKQPNEGPLRPNVDPTVRTGFDVDLHEIRTGDSYQTISKLHYGDAKYAEALRAFNKNTDLNRLREVEIPPMYVLRQKYSQYVGAMRPTPESTRSGGVEWAGTGTSEKTYTVPRDGMTLREVAAEVYGTPKEWEKIWNENLRVNPDEKLPVGRVIKLPK